MSMPWFLSQLHWQRPGFWLLVSFVVSVLLLAINWRFPAERRRGWRLARWFLIPYLGMVAGGISPRLMGLSDIDWVAGLGLGLALIFAIWVLLILMRATLHLEDLEDEGGSAVAAALIPSSALWQVLAAGAQEFHWTFLRAAVHELLHTLPIDLALVDYWALWIASLLAVPGIIVYYRRNSQRLIAAVVLLTTAILYLYTRNFWLCWLLHTTVQLLLGQHALHRQPVSEL